MNKLTYIASTLTALIFSVNVQATTCSGGGEYSSWMERLYSAESDVRLRDIAIPGTHDAGTFSIKSISAIEAVSVTQSRDLCEQAKDGIRYFDLRVRNDDSNDKFIIVHGPIRGEDLPLVLDPLYQFAKTHPKEILIMDFQELNDFADNEDVQRFNDYFLTKFSDRLIPNSSAGVNLNAGNIQIADAWHMNRNIIVLAKDSRVLASSNYYWQRSRNIDSPWANAAKVEDLKLHQDAQIILHQNTNKFYVSQMQLTFMGSGGITDKFTSLKSLADEANTYLSQWMMSYEIDQGLSPNIIMVDYYERRSKVVETSLAIDLRRQGASLADTKALFPNSYGAIYPLFGDVTFKQLKNGYDKCLDLEDRSLENGNEIHQWRCHDADSQGWYLDPDGYLRNQLDFNKCATVSGEGDKGTNVEIWDCNNQLNQRWSEFGDHGLRSQYGDQLMLDIKGGYWSSNGSKAHLWTHHGGDSQQWYWHQCIFKIHRIYAVGWVKLKR